MIEQAAKLLGPCQGCGAPCVGWAVQLVRGDRLRWEVEWACDACGVSHRGAWGPAPLEVRSQILAQHGPHCVRLKSGEHRGGVILKVLRSAFNLSIREAQEAAERLKQTGYQGTYVEVQFLAELMQREGVPSEVVSGVCEPGSSSS